MLLLLLQDIVQSGPNPHSINHQLVNGMEYVIRAKGPALGPVRSFSADRREKSNQLEREKKASNKIS